jgi:hypothetical protein
MNERYKRFVPHEDNVQEIISSDHVNELQDQSQANQKELFRQADEDFVTKALFTLENHPVINSMYIDDIEVPDKLEMTQSPGLAFHTEERAISFDGTGAVEATLVGKTYINVNSTNIKQIILMSDAHIPSGAKLIYEVSNDGGANWYNVTAGSASVFEFPTNGATLKTRVKFLRAATGEAPVLYSYAILYRDPKYVVTLLEELPPGEAGTYAISHQSLVDVGPDDHHAQMHAHDGTDGSGLISHSVLTDIGEDDHHSKDHRHGQDGIEPVHLESDVVGTLGMEHLSYVLQTGLPGDLQLIRNPDAYDKLVQVISPDNITYLSYDWANEGRLEKTITVYGDIAAEESMTYGDYTDSYGNVTVVMLGTTKYIKDATDASIQAAIAQAMAPAP